MDAITIVLLVAVVALVGLLGYMVIRETKSGNTSSEEFVSNLAVLNAIIQTELDIYDNDIFERKGGLNNQEFENYLASITKDIISKISDEFIKNMSRTWTREAIYEYVVRKVKAYLIEQVYIPDGNPFYEENKSKE